MEILSLERNQILEQEILRGLILIKLEAIELSTLFLVSLWSTFLEFVGSYREYSIANIREKGLAEILWVRANRFFKLGNEEPENEGGEEEDLSFRQKVKRVALIVLKKSVRLILLPFYLLILLLEFLARDKSEKDKKRVNKYVKNSYIE